MTKQGFFKIWRQLFEKPIWLNSTPEQKTILITLINMANWKTNTWEWKGKSYHCKPGEFITSIGKIVTAGGKGISRQNVRTALLRFQDLEFLNYETSKGWETGIKVKILNWQRYQPNQPSNHFLTNLLTNLEESSNLDIAMLLEGQGLKPNQPIFQKLTNLLTTIEEDKEIKKYINNTHTINVGDKTKNVCVENQNLSEEDLKLLKKYAKENGAKNLKPYIAKLISNGAYVEILEEEKKKAAKRKAQQALLDEQKEEAQQTQEPELTEEERQQALERARELAGIPGNKRRGTK